MKKILLKSMLFLSSLVFSLNLSAQFTEGFEGGTTVPAGWTVINNGGTNEWEFGTPPTGSAYAGTNAAYIEYETDAHDDYLVTPQISVTANTSDRLRFFAKNRSGSFLEEFNILISTTGNAEADFTVTLDGPITPPDSWDEYVYDLSAYIGQDIYIAFQAVSTNRYGLYLDDISIEAMPTCPEPSTLNASNITATSADLDWTENGSATLWDIELGAVGFTPTGTPTNTGVTTNPFNLTGLTPETDYDFYVRSDCGGGDESIWVGPFSFSTPVTCPAPSTLNASNITATTADLDWTENGAATTWNIELGTVGFTPTGTPTDAGVANPFNLTGLTQNTGYDFYVQADCGSGDESAWVGPFSFTTICGQVVAPWTYDVETATATTRSEIEDCWSSTPNNTTSDYRWNVEGSGGDTPTSNTGPDAPFSGSSYFYIEATSGSSGDVAYLTTPTLDVSGLTTPFLSFYYHMYGEDIDELSVEASDDNGATWDPILSITGEQQSSGADLWKESIANLGAYNSTLILRFKAVKGASYEGDIAIDDISIIEAPSCIQPTNLELSSLSTTSAGIAWTENGSATTWNIEYDIAGFTPTGTGTSVGTNPYTLTGLTPDTDYDLYVQADCGNGDVSTWVGPLNFYTGYCQPSATNNSRYIDDFETTGADVNVSNMGSGFASNGYSTYTTDTIYAIRGTNVDFSVNYGGTSTYGFKIWIDENNNLDFEPSEVAFQTSSYSGSHSGQFTVPNTDGIYRMRIGNSFTPNSGPADPCATGYSSGEFEDYIIETYTASCMPPSDLTIANITSSSADLGWTENGTASTWNIEYGPVGFAPTGTPTNTGVTSNPFTLSGLTQNTEYDFYVQADCGGGDESNWTGPFSFKTLCDVAVAPWDYDVETAMETTRSEIEDCWSSTPNNTTSDYRWNVEGSGGGTPSTSTGPSGPNSGQSYFYIEASSGSTGDIAELYTPTIDVSGLNAPALKFHHHMYGNDIDNLSIEVTDDAGVTWNNELTITGPQLTASSDDWIVEYVDISSYSNEIQIRFSVVKGASYYGDVAIDDISVIEMPTCFEPLSLDTISTTTTSVELTWVEQNSATSWEIEYGLSGFTPGSGTTVTAGTNPFDVTGLNPSASYDFYVRSDCGGGDFSPFAGPISVYTRCGVAVAPFYEGFDSGDEPRCWENLSSNTSSTSSANFWKFSGQAGYAAANNGRAAGTFAWSDGSSPTPDSMMLITPEIDISPLTTPFLGFEWFSNNEDYPGDNVPLYVSVYDGSTWNLLDVLSGDSAKWQFASYDLSAYAGGVIKVRFMTDQTVTSNSAHYNDILVDEVKIDNCVVGLGQGGTQNVCRTADSIDLNNNIVTRPSNNGFWTVDGYDLYLTNDSIFTFGSLPAGTYEANYLDRYDVCYDTTTALINVYNESSAGTGSSITACKFEMLELFSHLSGNVDMGGDWYDYNGNLLPNAKPTSPGTEGPFEYLYVVSNGVCPADTAIVEVTVDLNCSVSLDSETFTDISVYPNPTKNQLNVVNPSNTSSLKVEMFDMNGRVVLTEDKALNNASEATLSIGFLEKGIYTLRVYNDEGQKTFKIVKQ